VSIEDCIATAHAIFFHDVRKEEPDQFGWFMHPDLYIFHTEYNGVTPESPGEEGYISDRLLNAFGFESEMVLMEDDLDREDPFSVAYFEGGEADITDWNPSAPQGDGWKLVGKWDSEDGPVALFVRPIQ
jgi:hypothetical protein